MSFRLKTILGVAVIEALLLAILIGSSLANLRESHEAEIAKRVDTMLTLFASIAKDAVLASDLATLDSVVREVRGNPGVVHARVIDSAGHQLADSGVSDLSGDMIGRYSRGIAVADVEYGRVEVSLSLASVEEAKRDVLQQIAPIAVLEMILVALFSFLLGLYLTRQLGRLEEGAKHLAIGKFGYQIPVWGRDELARTAASFNEMSSRIHDLYRQISESQARYERLSELTAEGIIIHDGTRILDVNTSFCRLFGFDRKELVGQSFLHLPTKESRETIRRNIVAGNQDPYEADMQRKDGSIFPAEVCGRNVVYDGVSVRVASVRDISERHRVEGMLRKLSMAIEQSPVSVVITDLNGAIEYVNPRFCQATGYTLEEVQGRNPRILQSGRTAPEVYDDLWRTLMAGAVWHGEMVNKRKNGDIYWEFASISPIKDRDGRITHYVGVKEDVTNRKMDERKVIEASAALQRSNADLEQFSYAISHDLQAPLRNIVSFLQLLQHRFKAQLGGEGDELIAIAVDSGKRMTAMIRDLLEFSRVNTQGNIFGVVDLNRAATQALSNLRIAVQEADARVDVEDLPVVLGDSSQLMRLFQNLIGNAIKYRRSDVVPSVSVTSRKDGEGWEITIADNGIGIDSRQFDRLFKVFQRLHGPNEFEGTGVGLAVCRRIVERHGGRIWVESDPGQGSRFIFTLGSATAPTPGSD
ncbi:MAG: PAS domain S-box protein [Magnetospirillum sp. WYHS-4]